MRDLDRSECDELEHLIDRCGLSSVLMALCEICDLKAMHIPDNKSLAKDWATVCGRIGVMVPSVVARGL